MAKSYMDWNAKLARCRIDLIFPFPVVSSVIPLGLDFYHSTGCITTPLFFGHKGRLSAVPSFFCFLKEGAHANSFPSAIKTVI